jgi:hypothetical protein
MKICLKPLFLKFSFFPLRTLLFGLCLIHASCEREPLERFCPPLLPGQLVISEIRGKQTQKEDTHGEWIELYNGSDDAISLGGISIKMMRLDGSGPVEILIRDQHLMLEPKSYAVLGSFKNTERPDYADYGFLDDFSSDLYDSGVLAIDSCTNLVDQVAYQALPGVGTLALDGTSEPDGERNDLKENWCVDSRVVAGDGAPGTPKEKNVPCNQ